MRALNVAAFHAFGLSPPNHAEALLFSHLPWTDACLGGVFTIDGQDGRKPQRRRRVFLKGNPVAIELSLPDTHPDIRGLPDGTPIKVQHETSKADPARTKIHRICRRTDGAPMDVLPSLVGVIDRINPEKALIHVIVARGVDGICPISLYPGQAEIGATVAVRLAKHWSKNGLRTRITYQLLAMLPSITTKSRASSAWCDLEHPSPAHQPTAEMRS